MRLLIILLTLIALTPTVCMKAGSVCCDRDTWLKWSDLEREVYMQAHVQALVHGYSRGCESAFDIMKARKIDAADEVTIACHKSNPTSGIDFSAYTAQITKFYVEHPQARERVVALIDRLMKGDKLE